MEFNTSAQAQAKLRWNSIAKPLGGLGLLEDMVSKIAGMRGDTDVTLRKRTAVIMCADNGVVREGVSQSDSSVTAAVAHEIAGGRSSVNLLAEQFSAEVFNFIFADKDKVAVNAKIQQIVGQLPLRMTKARFYDIIGQTLSIYNGCEISSLDDFIETVEETALLQLPEKFETEYSSLHEAYEIIKEGDYAHLDFDGYRNLSTVLDKSAGFINDVVSDYMMLIELVNDLYSMMLAAECKSGVSESCMRALSIIRRIYESMENEDEFPTDAYDMLVANEGAQEEAGEHRMVLEAPIYDIVSSNQPDIIRLGLEDAYHRIDTLEKLLSGSMFVDIDHVKIETGALADSEYIISKKDKLIEEFGEVFTGNSQVVNRAVMAKILSTIPVFFNTQQEIKDYIDNALVRCSNRSEVLACYVIIQGIMED